MPGRVGADGRRRAARPCRCRCVAGAGGSRVDRRAAGAVPVAGHRRGSDVSRQVRACENLGSEALPALRCSPAPRPARDVARSTTARRRCRDGSEIGFASTPERCPVFDAAASAWQPTHARSGGCERSPMADAARPLRSAAAAPRAARRRRCRSGDARSGLALAAPAFILLLLTAARPARSRVLVLSASPITSSARRRFDWSG